MHMVMNLLTNKKIIKLIVLFILLVFSLLVVFVFDLNCIFKSIFHIPCPGCGLTRAFKLILKGHFIQSLKYSVLALPILLFLVLYLITLIYDIIKKTDINSKYLNFFVKHYKFILVLVLISWILNIVRGI